MAAAGRTRGICWYKAQAAARRRQAAGRQQVVAEAEPAQKAASASRQERGVGGVASQESGGAIYTSI